MQPGAGAENAFAGIATAYSDGVPILVLPTGQIREFDGVSKMFSSVRSFRAITKFVERIDQPDRTVETMRRAFASLKMGRPGPVMVEIPRDVAREEIDPSLLDAYKQPKPAVAQVTRAISSW